MRHAKYFAWRLAGTNVDKIPTSVTSRKTKEIFEVFCWGLHTPDHLEIGAVNAFYISSVIQSETIWFMLW